MKTLNTTAATKIKMRIINFPDQYDATLAQSSVPKTRLDSCAPARKIIHRLNRAFSALAHTKGSF